VQREKPTVDGDGDAFGQNISIRANKSWNLSEFVIFEVIGWSRWTSNRLLYVQFKLVSLCNELDGRRASVVLEFKSENSTRLI
jgi:hypothetical protein